MGNRSRHGETTASATREAEEGRAGLAGCTILGRFPGALAERGAPNNATLQVRLLRRPGETYMGTRTFGLAHLLSLQTFPEDEVAHWPHAGSEWEARRGGSG